MDALSKHIEFKDTISIPYSIESLDEMSYVVFYLEHRKGRTQDHLSYLSFLNTKPVPLPHHFKGCINWNQTQTSYLFYYLENVEREFLRSDEEDVWKVTPYELLYTRGVTDIPIHAECVDFFKAFPSLFMVEDHEIPIVAYIGVGESEINEQILLQNKNEKKGILGQGYYFTSYENAEYDSLYMEETEDHLVRIDNKYHLTDHHFQDNSVYIKGHRFYHHTIELGEVPLCKENVTYSIYYYDKDVIYLKSTRPHGCKNEVKRRKEDGYVMRYVLFLKKHSVGKNKGYDSYAYDSTYMVRHSDHFICLSYHSIKKK